MVWCSELAMYGNKYGVISGAVYAESDDTRSGGGLFETCRVDWCENMRPCTSGAVYGYTE
jgi:hypothetical protein